MIPIFSNTLGEQELEAVEQVFASRWLGRGKECAAFEREFADYLGTEAEQLLLTNCCTSAIELALRALGIGVGDDVLVPTCHFVAAATVPMRLGARPVLADVNPRTLNLEPEEVARRITSRTKAILLLHYGGHACDVDGIREAAGPKVAIIEDAANAVGSTYKGRACGTLGDAAVWSFDAMKVLVMGDGGALWLRDPEVAARARALRYLGLKEGTTSGTDAQREGKRRWWEFAVGEPSGRYVSNDVLAAVGRVQLRRLPEFLARRAAVWRTYQEELADSGLMLPPEPLYGKAGHYLYWVQTPKRDALANALREAGVYTTFRYYPLHRATGDEGHYPGADWAAEQTLNLPLHQNLTDGDLGTVIEAVKGGAWRS